MNNKLQLFSFEGKEVRTLKINDEPYFVGKDVATILGYAKAANAISQHVDDEDKGVTKMMTPGGNQNIQIINESGMYSLILSSKLPNAKKFKHWVTSEVLPAIHKHGAYMTDEKALDVVHNKTGLDDLLQQAADQLKQKDIQIEEMKPKALFADAVATSKRAILVGELAKLLRQNGVKIGQNRLFKWMREHGYLMKSSSSRNMPTQRSSEMGLFKIVETTITHSDGVITVNKTPKVTGKGQQYFINKFLNDGEE